jgi:hypothetical protein
MVWVPSNDYNNFAHQLPLGPEHWVEQLQVLTWPDGQGVAAEATAAAAGTDSSAPSGHNSARYSLGLVHREWQQQQQQAAAAAAGSSSSGSSSCPWALSTG